MTDAPPPSPRPARGTRAEYRYFRPITTRWMDNDAYGHVNNVLYHAWFDTAVNHFLIAHGLLELGVSPVVGIMAENGCRYHSEIAYPAEVTIGTRIARIGRSSVRWESAAFRDDEAQASAEGFLVHVYCARATMRPVSIPDHIRAALASVAVSQEH